MVHRASAGVGLYFVFFCYHPWMLVVWARCICSSQPGPIRKEWGESGQKSGMGRGKREGRRGGGGGWKRFKHISSMTSCILKTNPAAGKFHDVIVFHPMDVAEIDDVTA